MIDHHIHIGQFREIYYDPLEVVNIVMSSPYGLKGLAFSSTTSCGEDVSYTQIEAEIQGLLCGIAPEQARPFFWFIPDYINQGVNIENASCVIPYQGIKLHPYAQSWDFENHRHLEALHRLFDYAAVHRLPVLIHSGYSGVDSADRFEGFFIEYRKVPCIIAHCRPLDKTIAMLELYDQVYCDTAFVSENTLKEITLRGLGHKCILGTDFPITHYFRAKEITLEEQYGEDLRQQGELLKNEGFGESGLPDGGLGVKPPIFTPA